jgi:DNA-binding GntR family transcriptional regulator
MEAYRLIKQFIVEGKYEPGERLTEEKLAEDLEISRTPIREAIKQLESERLIIRLKKGIKVREFNKEDIKQIYNLRALLEGFAAEEAAQNWKEENIRLMQDSNKGFAGILNREFSKNAERTNMIMEVNNQFHKAVLLASSNDHLSFHISNVTVLPLVFRSFYWYEFDQLKKSYDLHETITSAVIERDSIRAKTAMMEHIYQGRDHVMQHIKNKGITEEEKANDSIM